MLPIYSSECPVPPAGFPPLSSTSSPARQPLPRQKFEHIMRLLESLNPSICLHWEKIEDHFSKLNHCPDHPPYASMIQRAITELNEKGGSSEETISKFIEAEYEDLPIAHAAQLTHHLQKLVTKGEIVSTFANCYMLPFENTDFLRKLKKENKRSKRCGQNRKNSRQHQFKGVQSQKLQKIEDSQEQNQVQLENFERIEEQKQAEQKICLIGGQKNQGNVELIGEQNEVEELRLKVVEEQTEAEQVMEGNEEHDKKQEVQNQQQKELDLQQGQAPSKTIGVAIEENYRAEGRNQAAKKSEVTETEHRNYQEEDELTEEQNEVEELRLKVVEQIESEKEMGRNEENDQMEVRENQQQKELNLPQSQVQSETFDLTFVEKYQEGTNHTEKNRDVTEAEHQKEQEDEVTEEPYHKEHESKKHEEKNLTTNPESEVGDGQAQFPDIQLEEMMAQIDPERRHFEGSEEEKRLQEQKMEVCSQIFGLSNMLLQLMKKENEVKATVSIQNNVTGQNMDISDSSHLKKVEFMELLKMTNKIEGKLIDIISSLNLDVAENNNSTPKIRGQLELVEENLLQTENPCTGSETVLACGFQPKRQQQLDICSLVKAVGNCQKRPSEVEMTTLEDSFEKPCKQIKLSYQQETPKSQPRIMKISLDVPCDLPREENGSGRLVIQRTENVLEDTSETTEPNINFSDETDISRQETEKSYLNVCIDSEQLKNSELCGLEKLPESQLVTSSCSVPMELVEHDLEHQQQTSVSINEKISEYKQPENPIEERHGERKIMLAEHLSQTQQQMVRWGQQTKLQPFSQMPATSQLDTATFVAKQLDQASLVSLKSEQKKKSQLSILKRLREQRWNYPCEKKRLKSQPTETTVVSASTSQQQEKGGLWQRQLWQQGEGFSQSESVVEKRREPLPFQHQQHGQEQPQPRRGRPCKLKLVVETATGELMVDHQHHRQKKSQRNCPGRPPKPKEDAAASNHHRRLGRPPKSKLAAASGQEASLPLPSQHKGRGRPRKGD